MFLTILFRTFLHCYGEFCACIYLKWSCYRNKFGSHDIYFCTRSNYYWSVVTGINCNRLFYSIYIIIQIILLVNHN